MNDDYSKTKSRRLTPWTGRCDSTPLESYIDLCTGRDYDHRHPAILASGEAAFLNSYELSSCRFCGSGTIVKDDSLRQESGATGAGNVAGGSQ